MFHAILRLTICVLSVLGFYAASTLANDLQPRHVRVVWSVNPATVADLLWTTNQTGESSQVCYRVADQGEWSIVDCDRNEPFNGVATPCMHHTRLTGLEPATKYSVVCQTDGQKSREFHFLTAPDDSREVAMLFGGDSRSGVEARQQVNRMMSHMVAEQTAAGRPEILALAHGGDFIVNGTKLDQWLAWLDHHELTTSDSGRLLPLVPARGNHDMGPLFNQVFGFPSRDENYYAVSLSSNVRLATLNTETSTAGDQRKWLADELDRHRWRYRWYVAQYHKPAFPAVKIPSGALSNWVPLFEQYQLDLVCEADGHAIKRTPPIRAMKVDPQGVVYIGEGGLGVGQRTPKTKRWYLQDTAKACGTGHHVHLLTFRDQQLDVRVVKVGGKLFDEFTLSPRKTLPNTKPTTAATTSTGESNAATTPN